MITFLKNIIEIITKIKLKNWIIIKLIDQGYAQENKTWPPKIRLKKKKKNYSPKIIKKIFNYDLYPFMIYY